MSKAKLIIIATFVLGVFGVFPDKLSDFKDAVRAARNREGCTSIPYSDLRSNCDSQDRQVDDWCEGRKGPASCDEGRTRDAKNAVEREKRNVEELKEKKNRLDSDKSRASTDDEKNKIAKDIEQVERDIYEEESVSTRRQRIWRRARSSSRTRSTISGSVSTTAAL